MADREYRGMKIRLITNKGDWNTAQTGKGKFVSRLIPALKKIGVDTVNDMSPVDIDIQLGKHVYEPVSCKKSIVRMGPAHVDKSKDYKALNKRKSRAVGKADGVIYQSEFSKKMCDKFLGKATGLTDIIYNGANPEDYMVKKVSVPDSVNFLASTRTWTKQKRLKDIVKSFELANITGSCLYVAGAVKKEYKADNVNYLGPLDDRQIARWLRTCNTLISIVYLDACPNSVVEALNAGCNVVCTDMGGTHELAPSLVVKDTPWDFKPIDLNKPPKVNREALAEALRHSTVKREFPTELVHIDNVALRYKAFFERVLGE